MKRMYKLHRTDGRAFYFSEVNVEHSTAHYIWVEGKKVRRIRSGIYETLNEISEVVNAKLAADVEFKKNQVERLQKYIDANERKLLYGIPI
jgi:hypothetical protein